MKISVIIPAFNSAAFIAQAVESVRAKGREDLELIVVDDGSTDATKDVVADLKTRFPNIRYFYQANGGPGAARNRALKEARGEYIAFLDADDQLAENSLEERALLLDRNPQVGMVFSDYYVVRNAGDPLGMGRLRGQGFLATFNQLDKDKSWYVANKDFYKYYLSFEPNPIWTGTVMMRRSLIDRIGFFRTDIFVGEDRDYWMRILKNSTAGFIYRPLATYNNFQSQVTKKKERFHLDTIKSLQVFLLEPMVPRKIVKKEMAKVFYNFGHHYIDEDRWDLSKKYFLKCVTHDPWQMRYWVCLCSPSKGMIEYFRGVKRDLSKI